MFHYPFSNNYITAADAVILYGKVEVYVMSGR